MWNWTINKQTMPQRMLYLSLGSNLGDKKGNILRAVSLLDEALGIEHIRLSSFMQSPSWGFKGEDFLNVALSYKTALQAEEVLRICKSIEKRLGREEEGIKLDSKGNRVYKNRIIDIDILLLGNEKINTPSLVIPHPHMKEREFVIEPLREIFDGDLNEIA